MKKYSFKNLCIEITRKCNYKCQHCIQGDAQDKTITPEIIDAMFSQCETVEIIQFVGGESLLEIDSMEMILKKIDEYDLATKTVSFVTNGSILDISVLDILNDFVKRGNDRVISIIISDDKYHNKEQSQKAFDFYTANNPNKEQITIGLMSAVREADKEFSIDKRLVYDGRAKALYENDSDIEFVYHENYLKNHQICIKNGVVGCVMTLRVNGNLSMRSMVCYEKSDKTAIGNILTDTLEHIFTQHNDTCPFLCDECFNEILCKNMTDFEHKKDAVIKREISRVRYGVYQKRTEFAWMLRTKAKQRFPTVPMRAIIDTTPVMELQEWLELLLSVEKMAKKYNYDVKSESYYQKYYRDMFPDATTDEIEQLCNDARLYNDAEIYLDMISKTDVSKFKAFKELVGVDDESYIDMDVCGAIPDFLVEYK